MWEGKLAQVIPGIGAFHFMWEILRLLIGEWWGGQAEGSLGGLKAALNSQKVTKDGKKFSSCDEFIHAATRVKVLEAFHHFHGKSALEVTKEALEKMSEAFVSGFVLTPQQKGTNDQFFASQLQASLLYLEVSFKKHFNHKNANLNEQIHILSRFVKLFADRMPSSCESS